MQALSAPSIIVLYTCFCSTRSCNNLVVPIALSKHCVPNAEDAMVPGIVSHAVCEQAGIQLKNFAKRNRCQSVSQSSRSAVLDVQCVSSWHNSAI